ncbi:LysR substrate-binding domain-containing protein [Pelagimonas sp. KU-00592-HH]|uniref:LysR substrate-binding domain-containing protein n=1 Tax=Pelagimonas sp. KU-00592-HH TaxID=3127651 RepID=UPI00310AF3C7
MARTYYDLPPLSALDAFEAAARHRSFKRAAGELNVTPAAVSHQIKGLETELGLVLFERHRRGVELNPEGAMLYAALERGFSQIGEAIAALRHQAEHRGVRIASTTALSYLWLTPRLARFWREFPNVRVTQELSDVEPEGARADLEIRYGHMSEDAGDCRLLFRDVMVPLASPAFAAEHPVTSVEELAKLPLIHLHSPEDVYTTWPVWFREVGYEGPLGDLLHLNNYIIALQAAQDGIGVVLGWREETRPMLESGALVPLMDLEAPAPREFYIRAATGASKQALLLRDWLVRAAEGA